MRFELDLKALYQLYSSTVKYSLSQQEKIEEKRKPSQVEERKSDFLTQTMPLMRKKEEPLEPLDLKERPRSQSKTDEDNLCSICLEKPIQVVLPCFVNEKNDS